MTQLFEIVLFSYFRYLVVFYNLISTASLLLYTVSVSDVMSQL